MRIGIIGPNRVPHLDDSGLLARKNKLARLAEILAKKKVEILLTPDKESLLEFFGKKYLEAGGQKIYEVIPLDDDYEKYLNTDLGEIISCEKWPNQPAKFNEECDVIFCVGYAGMVLAEIGCSEYYNPKTVYIIKDFISAELPKEIKLSLEYVELGEVKNVLEKILINNK